MKALRLREANRELLEQSLVLLLSLRHRATGKQAILLLDEYEIKRTAID
ncbi:hypothetical protein WDW89_05965 [Deltaproteobacteria bacterium TL4]